MRAELGERVDGRGDVVPTVAHTSAGVRRRPRRRPPSGAARCRGPHRQRRRVDLDARARRACRAGDPGRLLDRGVGLGRRCRRVYRPAATPSRRGARRRWPGAARRAGRPASAPEAESWITPPPVPVGAERGRQVEQLGQPVQHRGLELGGGRAGRPEHALHAEAGADQVAQHDGPGGVGREVAEEAGVLPVRDAGQDTRSRSARTASNGSPLLRRAGGQRRRATSPGATRDRTGSDSHAAPVVGDPVDDLVAVLAELLGGHVPRVTAARHRPRQPVAAVAGPQRRIGAPGGI